MNVLRVYPRNPDSFWSFRHVLRLVAKKSAFPPLGLLTVAAMLPRDWNLELIDLNVAALTDHHFLKRQLIYVPTMGLACALDFPFMRRHTQAALGARPELRIDDVNSSRRGSEKFARLPTSVTNFVEGTRFTPLKQSQHSPYRHLLKPKACALALALEVLGSRSTRCSM